MEDLLSAIEVQTGADPEFSVICLHGLGADAADLVPIVQELGLDDCPALRFVFPNAPLIPVTCNGGYEMRAWYDIISLGQSSRNVDEAGVIASRRAIQRLIARENQRGVPTRKIFIAGFSQGGAIAYMTALTHPERLAGVIGLSTYIPSLALLADELSAANHKITIFAAHGTEDEVVTSVLGLAARDFLIDNGYRVVWHEYPMGHAICMEELDALGAWLRMAMAECPIE